MKTIHFWILCGTAVVLVTAGVVQAGSIWAKSTARTQAMYNDDTARKVGDSLTILISERGIITNETKRNMDKQTMRNAHVEGQLGTLSEANSWNGKFTNLSSPLDIKSNAETKFNSDVQFNSDRSMTDQVTVTVLDVLPNGNLVVVGTRTRVSEGDKQIIQVSGIVRPSDIAFDNSVGSGRVADFNIVYKHAGQENNFTNPGWLGRILNFVSPW